MENPRLKAQFARWVFIEQKLCAYYNPIVSLGCVKPA